LNPNVASVASLFIGRWDVAVASKVPATFINTLGIALAKRSYNTYLGLIESPRWRRAFNAGARPQRLLFASTGPKDLNASDILYVKGLIAPLTVNMVPEGTLKAFADHGELGPELTTDGGDCERVLAKLRKAGVDLNALAATLQEEGAASFVASWNELLGVIASKRASLAKAG
jgi:transaldolase